jgi:hypothetical protein
VNRSERLARGWRGLLICPACLDLFHEGGRGRALAQQCRCRPRGRTWPGLDFNEWARLCDCCVGELLTSGWRFSVWFCDECKPRVWELNKRHGYAVVPIGRHSLMNGVFLSGSDAVAEVDGIVSGSQQTLQTFAESSVSMFSSIDHLHAFKEKALGRALERLGFMTSALISVPQYLERLTEARTVGWLTKEAAFADLCRHFGLTPAST